MGKFARHWDFGVTFRGEIELVLRRLVCKRVFLGKMGGKKVKAVNLSINSGDFSRSCLRDYLDSSPWSTLLARILLPSVLISGDSIFWLKLLAQHGELWWQRRKS